MNNMHIESLMWLFPIAFMFHDFEEIIFLPSWIKKNKTEIFKRIPNLAKPVVSKLANGSARAFSMVVFEEFMMLSILTYICVEYRYYSFFAALIAGYLFHIFVHIVQSIVVMKYIPAVGTGIITAIYSIYALDYLNSSRLLDWEKITILSPIIIVMMVINLLICHWFAGRFEDHQVDL